MQPVYLFDLVNTQRDWLSARQSLVTQNIANATSPGYKTLDVAPFSQLLERNTLDMATNNPLHIRPSADGVSTAVATKETESWETVHSGNNVALEAEMIKEANIRNAFALDTNILKTFHGMWMASLKG